MRIELEGRLEQWIAHLSHSVAQAVTTEEDDDMEEASPSLYQLKDQIDEVDQKLAALAELQQECDAVETRLMRETLICAQVRVSIRVLPMT
jgi:hypothetical protein